MSLPARKPAFTLQTQSLGALPVYGIRVKEIPAVQALTSDSALPPNQFLDNMIEIMVRKPDETALSGAEVSQLTAAEKDAFIDGVLAHSPELTRERVSQRKNDEEGRPVISLSYGDVIYPQQEGELKAAYFQRLQKEQQQRLAEQQKKMAAQFKETIDRMTKNWLSPDTLKSLTKNFTLSSQLSDQLKQFKLQESQHKALLEQFTIPKIDIPKFMIPALDNEVPLPPPTPRLRQVTPPEEPPVDEPPSSDDSLEGMEGVHTRLDTMIDRMEDFQTMGTQTVELVQSMNETAQGMVIKFAEGASSAEKASKITLALAIIAILASVVVGGMQMYADYVRQRDGDKLTTQLAEKIANAITENDTRNAEQLASAIKQSQAAQDERNEVLVKAIDALTAATKSSPRANR